MYTILPREAMHKRGLCYRPVSIHLCICLSYAGIVSKRKNTYGKTFSAYSRAINVILIKRCYKNSEGSIVSFALSCNVSDQGGVPVKVSPSVAVSR